MENLKILQELEDFIKVSCPDDISERCANKLLQLICSIKNNELEK